MFMVIVLTSLFLKCGICEDIDSNTDEAVSEFSRWTEIKPKIISILRENYGRKTRKRNSENLIHFLECLKSTPSYTPPVTLDEYKDNIKECLHKHTNVQSLKQDSVDVLEDNDISNRIFQCFTHMKIINEDEDYNSLQIIKCLNEGDPETAVENLIEKFTDKHSHTQSQFKKSFQNCIIRNIHKIDECMNLYQKDNISFYAQYIPSQVTRSNKKDKKKNMNLILILNSNPSLLPPNTIEPNLNNSDNKYNTWIQNISDTKPIIRTKKWEYSHVSSNLIRFLKCLGTAPTHIPPITIGKYRLLVKKCFRKESDALRIKSDSYKAIDNDLPEEAYPIFKCFIHMNIRDDDENQNAAEVIKCLREGDVILAVKKLNNIKNTKSPSECEIAEAFHNCIEKEKNDVNQCKKYFKREKNYATQTYKEDNINSALRSILTNVSPKLSNKNDRVTKFNSWINIIRNTRPTVQVIKLRNFGNINKEKHRAICPLKKAFLNCFLRNKYKQNQDNFDECQKSYKKDRFTFLGEYLLPVDQSNDDVEKIQTVVMSILAKVSPASSTVENIESSLNYDTDTETVNVFDTKPIVRVTKDYSHVDKGLTNFLKCLGSAPSSVPPITLGKYRDLVKECLDTLQNGVEYLKEHSTDALKKDVPREVSQIFQCFTEIDKKNDDTNRHAARIITCLNLGNPQSGVKKIMQDDEKRKETVENVESSTISDTNTETVDVPETETETEDVPDKDTETVDIPDTDTDTKPIVRVTKDYSHVDKGLTNFLKCLGSAPSSVPPITLGKYRDLVKKCLDTLQNGVEYLKEHSTDALKKDVPREVSQIFQCFTEIDKKNDDTNRHAARIITCLNLGNPQSGVKKIMQDDEKRKETVENVESSTISDTNTETVDVPESETETEDVPETESETEDVPDKDTETVDIPDTDTDTKPNVRVTKDYSHVDKGLIDFLKCLGSAPSFVPPVTLGKYRDLVKECLDTLQNGVEYLKKHSTDALKKDVPGEVSQIFQCFTEIDEKNNETNRHAARVITCLNRGNPQSGVIKMKPDDEKKDKANDGDDIVDTFPKMFQNCILQSKKDTNVDKVTECNNIYQTDNITFSKMFQRVIRTHVKEDTKKYEESNNKPTDAIISYIWKKYIARTISTNLFKILKNALVKFLMCIGYLPNHVRSIKTIDYSNIIKVCLDKDNHNACDIKKESMNALESKNPIPSIRSSTLECFGDGNTKDCDENHYSEQLKECLQMGNAKTPLNKPITIGNKVTFSDSLNKCLKSSKRETYEEKFMQCMNLYNPKTGFQLTETRTGDKILKKRNNILAIIVGRRGS